MTRVALLADIHGNLPALEAVLADLGDWCPDEIVVAGDAVCWGPESREVLERLAEVGAVCVRGNNEYYLLDWETPRMPASWAGYGLLPPMVEDVGEAWRRRVGTWPDEVSLRFTDGPLVRVCHGVPGNPWLGAFPVETDAAAEAALAAVPEEIVVVAHTHIPFDRSLGGKRVINPGSVGVPLDRDRRASYARLEAMATGWRCEHRRVPYDTARLDEAFARTRFLERNGNLAELVMREFTSAHIQVLPFLLFRREERPDLSEAEALKRFDETALRRHTPRNYRV